MYTSSLWDWLSVAALIACDVRDTMAWCHACSSTSVCPPSTLWRTRAVTLTVTLAPGTYVLFCTLPQHAADGMKTTIVVK